jgi:hypothetical protein
MLLSTPNREHTLALMLRTLCRRSAPKVCVASPSTTAV